MIGRELSQSNKQDLLDKLKKQEEKYHKKKSRKYYFMLVGMALFGYAGWQLMTNLRNFTYSLYDRTGLEKVTTEQFGDVRISEVLTEDVLIVTYDFIGQRPVIFTKYAAKNNPLMN